MDLALNNLQRLICHKTQQTIKALLEFELGFYDAVVQRFNHYASRLPPTL